MCFIEWTFRPMETPVTESQLCLVHSQLDAILPGRTAELSSWLNALWALLELSPFSLKQAEVRGSLWPCTLFRSQRLISFYEVADF